MNLVIDIGNTRTKTALFDGENLVELFILKSPEDIFNANLLENCAQIIVSSVKDDVKIFLSELSKLKPTILFTSLTKTPIENNYESLSTLGSDRISAAVGGYYLYPNKNVLVIDAGTCIKYNFTNSNNQYLGGGISPGIEMRFKALQKFTDKLPLIEIDLNFNSLIGASTQSSILSGVLNGTISEIDGIINLYKLQFPDLICILTGGDSQYLANRLKNSIFTHQNLVLKGLNNILNYTIETNN